MTYKQQLQWEEENNQVADNISFLQEIVEAFTDSPRLYIRHSIEIKLAKRIFWEHLNGPADIRVRLSIKVTVFYFGLVVYRHFLPNQLTHLKIAMLKTSVEMKNEIWDMSGFSVFDKTPRTHTLPIQSKPKTKRQRRFNRHRK